MGCNSSKLDRLPAVALCRDRRKFLEEALCQSYALADAHVSHMQSLKTLGAALRHFFETSEESGDCTDDPKPNLPNSPPPAHSPPQSTSFPIYDHKNRCDSGSEAEEREKDFEIFNETPYNILNRESQTSITKNMVFMNYVPPLYDPSSPPPSNSIGYSAFQPPSPPPPGSGSAWDFLNFFEPYERYEMLGSPNRDRKKDLKEKETCNRSSELELDAMPAEADTENHEIPANGNAGNSEDLREKDKKSSVMEKGESEAAVKREPSTAKRLNGVAEVMKEIHLLFERASESGNGVLEMLDVGKLRYHQKVAVNKVSCKVMNVFSPCSSVDFSQPSGLVNLRSESSHRNIGLSFCSLSYTLKKLSMWEKKLYDEVKVEEKLNILYEKKCRQMMRLDKKCSDPLKVDSIKTTIGNISTKVKISIQMVDKISKAINKVREEELWPKIDELILRFVRMWKDLQGCYKCQHQAIAEAKSLGAFTSNKTRLSEAHLESAMKLKFEIENWNTSFSDWMDAQKSHVKALNGWLLRCLSNEPVQTLDCHVQLSPRRIGAPGLFVVCNHWTQIMDSLPEKEVIDASQGLAVSSNEILEQHIVLLQKVTSDKDLQRQVKIPESMHKMVQGRGRKMVACEELSALLPGDTISHYKLLDNSELLSSLEHIFAAMERFTANKVNAYEKLCQQIEEGNHL